MSAVELRNGERAFVNGRVLLGLGGCEEFLQGTRENGAFELWLGANGRWRLREKDHPLDIVRRCPSAKKTANATHP